MTEDRQTESASSLTKPWTIKGIPMEDRNAALAAANRADLSMGEWMCRAIRDAVAAQHRQSRSPTVIQVPDPPAPPAPPPTAAELDELLALSAKASNNGVPSGTARLVRAIVRRRLSKINREERVYDDVGAQP